MKKPILGTISALALAGVMAIVTFATLATTAFAAPEAGQPPTATNQAYTVASTPVTTTDTAPEAEQFRIRIGLPCNEASASAIPVEEARQLGISALAEFFGADLSGLDDYVIEMGYSPGFDPREWPISTTIYEFDGVDGRIPAENNEAPNFRWPINVYRSTWHGTIVIPNGRTPCPEGFMLRGNDLFRFTLDAQTGELVGLQFFPSEDPITRPYMQSECMGSALQVFEYRDNMTAQHNTEFASHAMQLAEEFGIFKSGVLRASVASGGWRMGRNGSFEINIAVYVESVDGETAAFTFQGSNRKELVDVNFYTRMINYAIDSDGSITDPVSQFVGNPEIPNWIYR